MEPSFSIKVKKKQGHVSRIKKKSARMNILINSHAILIKNIMCQENE